MKIPLKNKNDDIVAYTIIDKDDFEKVNVIKWYLSNGYANNSRYGRLHRFIMNAKKEDFIIDHLNGDKLDNRKENLRFVTYSQNSQNKLKKIDSSSKYYGVCFCNNKWKCGILKLSIYFDKEEHAAWWYDQLALKYFGPDAKINGIIKPNGFIEPIKINRALPKGIYLTKSNKYQVRININKKLLNIGTFETIQEAEQAYNKKKQENIIKLPDEISRNKDKIAIIKTSKNEEFLVDDNTYLDLNQYTWNNIHGYATAMINGRFILMHRHLLNPQQNEIIDHINNQTNDNRLSNLRITSRSFNSQNKTKQKNTSSKYYGVSIVPSGNFRVQIVKNGVKYNVGTFIIKKQ
jgi:hypothetical protein